MISSFLWFNATKEASSKSEETNLLLSIPVCKWAMEVACLFP